MTDIHHEVCPICQNYYGDELVLDHNHETEEVRGLLCRNCNSGLGLFKDDIDNFARAIDYLRDYE